MSLNNLINHFLYLEQPLSAPHFNAYNPTHFDYIPLFLMYFRQCSTHCYLEQIPIKSAFLGTTLNLGNGQP